MDNDIESFIESYIETAIWSSLDDSGKPLDSRFDAIDLSEDAKQRTERDCNQFIKENERALENISYYQAGHDFWLTRNGHGAGFWDGDYPEPEASILTESSRIFGTCELYLADDDKLWMF